MTLRFPNKLVTAAWLVMAGSFAQANVDELDGLHGLRDQFGVPGGITGASDGIQIAIVVSAKRLRRIKPWERAIVGFEDGLHLIRIADVPRETPTDFEQVAEKLRKRLPENVKVLIDLEGVWVKAFQLDSMQPNILVFDAEGQLLVRHSGMYKKSLFEALQADLEQIAAGSFPAPETIPSAQSP